jgi:CubicO group peptidase (beta-lactamase class C family)
MPSISRRTCLQRLALALPATLAPGLCAGAEATAPSGTETDAIAAVAKTFMEKFEVSALSVAFAVGEHQVFSAGYGLADKAAREETTPAHRFRIASVAKPVTSVAIFRLVEQGKLKLDDRVFGAGRWIDIDLPPESQAKLDEVTIHHLLDHTCGGWSNQRDDPMFMHPDLGHRELIERTLRDRPLDHPPGTHYAYSNFGYCLLGRIIEKISTTSYEDSIKEAVLKPCGITRMQIAGNTRAERAKNEVVYYDGEHPYGMNVRRMDSHGGWLASAGDLVKFLIHTERPDGLLKPASIATMTTAPPCHPGYACGWAVNAVRNRWHNGSLPGTSSIAVRTASGMSWAALTNVRREGIDLALDRMMWQMAKAVPAWKA